MLADFLAFLRDHLGLAQREFAKAKYLNNVSDAISLLEGALANDQTDMEDLLKQLLTLSGGTGLTNMTRPKDEELKAYKEAYNKTKNEFVAQLREIDTQLTVLEVLTKHNGQYPRIQKHFPESWPENTGPKNQVQRPEATPTEVGCHHYAWSKPRGTQGLQGSLQQDQK